MTFAALADPTRRAILARLSSGELSVQELAAPFKMSLPGVSKHLKVLEKSRTDYTKPRSPVAAMPVKGETVKGRGRLA